MKKVKLILLLVAVVIIRFISRLFNLSSWSGKGKYHTEDYFTRLGSRMLVVRDNSVIFLGNAFEVVIFFDKDEKPINMTFRFLMTEKGDLVFYGKSKSNIMYEKYKKTFSIQGFDC